MSSSRSDTTLTGLELLSSDSTAQILGLRPQSLRSMRVRGTGPTYVRIGGPRGRAFYKREDIEAWLGERRYRSTSEETVASNGTKGGAAMK